jgi:acetyl-CoA carboxylase carboxyltransferase component
VGIGAYLVRLGQRVIQKRNAPIILTGFQALNKVLGKPLYASNNQLGGVDIMAPNGITHQIVEDDFDGAVAILNWMSFAPSSQIAPPLLAALPDADATDAFESLPVSCDSPLRDIETAPAGKKGGADDDVRRLLSGFRSGPSWVGGFFDAHSFVEYQAAWAPTVVVARAKLGGAPIGVIAVETRSVEVHSFFVFNVFADLVRLL